MVQYGLWKVWLTPTQEQTLILSILYRSSLSPKQEPSYGLFLSIRGSWLFPIYKSERSCPGQWPYLLTLPFFGQDAGNLGRSTSSARQDLAKIGTDEVGNGSILWPTVVSLSHLTSTTVKKSLRWYSKTLMIEKFSNWLSEENIQHPGTLINQRSTTKRSLLVTMLFRSR